MKMDPDDVIGAACVLCLVILLVALISGLLA